MLMSCVGHTASARTERLVRSRFTFRCEYFFAFVAMPWGHIPCNVLTWVGYTIGQFEVFNGIVKHVTIDVMHKFVGRKGSSKIFRHDKTVFGDIARLLSHWVVRINKDHFVSQRGYEMATSKTVTEYSETALEMFSSFSSFAHNMNPVQCGLTLNHGGHHCNR